jgi:two-component system LytT family response regulator
LILLMPYAAPDADRHQIPIDVGGRDIMNGPIRALVVDDGPAGRDCLRAVLSVRPNIDVVGECQNGNEAICCIRKHQPDLVLLDVKTLDLHGFGALRAIASTVSCTILITGSDKFAAQAFEIAAIDYLVKPYSPQRLDLAIDRALTRLREHRVAVAYAQSSAVLADAGRCASSPFHQCQIAQSAKSYAERLVVSMGERGMVVPIADVVSFRADGYCVKAVTAATQYVLRGSLDRLERRLNPEDFLRVHRSAIVRVACVRALERMRPDYFAVVLSDGTRVAVSRSRRNAVMRALRCIEG